MDIADFPDDAIETPTYEMYEDKEGGGQPQALEAKDITPEAYNCYLNAEVLLPRGDGMKMGTVKCQKCDADGQLRGLENTNPILDTRTYEVEFLDGQITKYTANAIAENMWSQCNVEENQTLLMHLIMDYKKDGHAIAHADQYINVDG